jgi:hypothetical protein
VIRLSDGTQLTVTVTAVGTAAVPHADVDMLHLATIPGLEP